MFASAVPHCWSLSRTKQSIVSSCSPLTRSFTANWLSSKIACRKGSNIYIRITYNCASDVRDTRKQIRSLQEFVSIWITAITTGLRLGRSEVLLLSLRHYLPAQSQASITSTAWRREASKKEAIDDLLWKDDHGPWSIRRTVELKEWVTNCWWGWQNRTALEKCTHLYGDT